MDDYHSGFLLQISLSFKAKQDTFTAVESLKCRNVSGVNTHHNVTEDLIDLNHKSLSGSNEHLYCVFYK